VITGHLGATGSAGNAMSDHLEVSARDRLVHGFILPLLIAAGLIVAIEAGLKSCVPPAVLAKTTKPTHDPYIYGGEVLPAILHTGNSDSMKIPILRYFRSEKVRAAGARNSPISDRRK
jgi:hypothetical protein